MKNAFGGCICRLDTAEERLSDLEDISIETFKNEKQREYRWERTPEYPRTEITTKRVTYL